jgi:hypothetical protein
LAAVVGGLLWAAYGLFEMLQPWGQDTFYRDELGYEVITDPLLHWAYSLPGSLALLLTSLSLLGILRRLGLPIGRTSRAGQVLAYTALALAVPSVVGVVVSFDPLFTAPRIFGTLALGVATCLAGLDVRRIDAASGWGGALLALGVLGIFLLPLWPLVHAVGWIPATGGVGVFALFGLGWALTGVQLWFSREPRNRQADGMLAQQETHGMDHGHFDALTRSMAAGDTTRRVALRFVSGGLLGLLAARLGLPEGTAAKQKKRKRRPAPQKEAALRAEGKRKGKKGKGRKKPPRLCPVDCYDEGGRCCPGGLCVRDEPCCPGEKTCANDTCVELRGCCPEETPCSDGSCPIPGRCCPELYQCQDGSCIDPLDECCPDQQKCGQFGCFPKDECCPDEQECDGACIPEDDCCGIFPLCGECQEAVCEDGAWVCRGTTCPCEDSPPCRPGYQHHPTNCVCLCPDGTMGTGLFCCPPGTYAVEGPGFRNWCCDDAGCQCPIGWTPYRDSGLCYPGTPPA